MSFFKVFSRHFGWKSGSINIIISLMKSSLNKPTEVFKHPILLGLDARFGQSFSILWSHSHGTF